MVRSRRLPVNTAQSEVVLTPSYHVFRMNVPFQDVTFVPVAFNAGWYTHHDVEPSP